MESRIKLLGHPIHPMLIVLPLDGPAASGATRPRSGDSADAAG